MLKLYYDLLLGERVPEKVGFKAPAVKFAFADYVIAELTVYASGVTSLDLSSVTSWRGCVDVDTDAATEPLVRILPGSFDVTDAATGKIGFVIDCNTANFRDRITAATIGFLELYGHDADDRQIVRIRIPATMQLPGDPPGDHDPLAVPASSVRTLNGLPGNVVIKTAAGEALPAENGVITLPEIAPGTSVNGLTGAVVLTDENGTQLTAEGQNIPIPGANCVGDAELSGDNAFLGANSFTQPLTVAGRTVSGLYPDRNPVAQIPVLDDDLGVCHYLDATFTEISLSYPVWKLVEIRALVRSVNPAITGTVEITPYIDDVAQDAATINVGATWAAVTIPLIVETGSIRLVRTGGTLADGSWVTAAFRGITAMVTI